MAQPSFTPLQHGHRLHRAHNFFHHDNRQQRHRWFTFSPLLHHYCVAIIFSIFFIISRSHQNQNHLLNHHHRLQVSSFSIIIIISNFPSLIILNLLHHLQVSSWRWWILYQHWRPSARKMLSEGGKKEWTRSNETKWKSPNWDRAVLLSCSVVLTLISLKELKSRLRMALKESGRCWKKI